MVLMPVMLHALGPARFGVWGAAASLAWLSGVMDIGTGSALVTLVARAVARGHGHEARRHVAGALTLGTGLERTAARRFADLTLSAEARRGLAAASVSAKGRRGSRGTVFNCRTRLPVTGRDTQAACAACFPPSGRGTYVTCQLAQFH